MKLDCIRLLVKNFDECFSFYKDKLKLKVTWGDIGDDYASFEFDNEFKLSLYKSDLMSEAVGDSDKKLPVENRNQAAIIIGVDDVDEIYKRLSDEGLVFINSPKAMTGWGIYVVHLKDPEGNLIEFYSELDESLWDKTLLADKEKYSE